MKIAQSSLYMASEHRSEKTRTIEESLRMWQGVRRASSPENTPSTPRGQDIVTLSEAGMAAQSAENIKQELDDAVDNDPQLNLIRDMLEFLTGKKIQVFDRTELTSSAQQSHSEASRMAAGFGVEYQYRETYSESEETRFSAEGKVVTADGQEFQFKIELNVNRSYYEETQFNLRLGDAARQIDPLVLNFNGQAAQLSDQRFAFDLNADGQQEHINLTQAGTGFLVFDRNRDGKINNGTELFGPTTGHGFSELSGLDTDNNGWIDENDTKFAELGIWEKNDDGNDQIRSLNSAGVGAISLQHLATPFSLKNDDNQLLGGIKHSGIFLLESGNAGTIQEIDLTA